MRVDRQRGDTFYWGNTFASKLKIPVNRGQWICIEFMVKMNNPVTEKNGEQVFWINGEKKFAVGPGYPTGTWDVWKERERGTWATGPEGKPFEGFQWRTNPALNVNYFWLEHFVDSDPGCEAWFDDVVIATQYIGPMVTQAPPAASTLKR
jgi:hypothetical protein